VTPVDDDYFEHLERVRGETRKQKVMQRAREAVMQGVAGAMEVQMAAKGVEVDQQGNVIPAESEADGEVGRMVNGDGERKHERQGRSGSDAQVRIRESQDISLHNLNDHDGR